MARPYVATVTGIGVSNPYVFNLNITPGNIAIGCVISATATYTVQHTYDDPFAANFNPATATWFDHPSMTAKTTNAESNYAYPPRAARLNVTASTGTVTITIIQAGVSGG
jgi:hypothetical protein